MKKMENTMKALLKNLVRNKEIGIGLQINLEEGQKALKDFGKV